jgi:hypothetical protein
VVEVEVFKEKIVLVKEPQIEAVPVSQDKIVEHIKHVPVDQIINHVIEVPVITPMVEEKIVKVVEVGERIVEVPVQIEKIVQVRVEVPTIKEVRVY